MREKLSEYFLKTYDIPINYEKEILITAGSKAAIHFALMSILNPGDEVVIPEPYWVSYPEQVKLCHAKPVCVPYGRDVADIERYVTKKTRAIIINTPNNPTGYVYSEKEILLLLSLAERYNLWLLSDEAYSDFAPEGTFVSPGRFDREKKHTIIFNSISKNYGISGWRLGYVIGNEDVIFNVLKVNQHLITCPATILEHYVAKHFDEILACTKPQIAQLLERRTELASYMNQIGLRYLPGTATFYFFVSIEPSRLKSEEFATRLLFDENICVVPGAGYGAACDKFIRVSVGAASAAEIKDGLQKIRNLIERTSDSVAVRKKNALVVAGGIWQVPIISFLKERGYVVHVADPYLYSAGVKVADVHVQADVRDFNRIADLTDKTEFEFITTDQSDISVNTVAFLSEHRKLLSNPSSVTNIFVNKFLMRQFCVKNGIPCPAFSQIRTVNDIRDFIQQVGYPIILKPADSQSSRGISKIDESDSDNIERLFLAGLRYANCGYLIAEAFVDGVECTAEGFASNGKHRTLAISRKKHFRMGIASDLEYPADIPPHLYSEIERINDVFVNASGLAFGITHAEYMVDFAAKGIVLIEIACRGGGTLISSDIVPWVSGIDVYDLLHDNLVGGVTDVSRLNVLKRSAILHFFEFPPGKVAKISGLDKVRTMPGVAKVELSFKEGDELRPAEDDRSRQGFVIIFTDSPQQLRQLLGEVEETLQVRHQEEG